LQERYKRARYVWLWWAGGGLLALAFAAIAFRVLRSGPKRLTSARCQMLERVTVFSVLGLLRDIQQKNDLAAPEMEELAGSIAGIERHYFDKPDEEPVDLKRVAETWIRRVS
jgi:hypothetical protein